MKKIFIILPFVLALFLTGSCSQDNLDIPQKGVISLDNYYKTEADALAAVTTVYNNMAYMMARGLVGGHTFNYPPYTVLFNNFSDDMFAAGETRGDNDFAAEINEFRYNENNATIAFLYRSLYGVIYSANILTTYYKPDDPNANIRQYVAEARVWRAWCHMILAIGWRNAPLVTELLTSDSYPANSTYDDLMNFCIKEFGEAAANLPSKPNLTDKNATVRLTKEAAYAFMGKAQVYAGKYADAATNLKTNVIDKNLYALVPGDQMNNLFHVAGNYSTEKIFEFNVMRNTSLTTQNNGVIMVNQLGNYWNWRSDHMNSSNNPKEIFSPGWGGMMPRKSFCEALIANDGIDSYRRKAWFIRYDEVLYNLSWPNDATMTTVDQKRKDPQRGLKSDSWLYGCEGYLVMKRIRFKADECPDMAGNFLNNHVMMRYAEVLLLFAEAAQKSGQYTAEGLKALNDIQNRAHGGKGYVSKSLTLDDVKKEKRFEMWLEEVRGIDLVRWGDAATVLKDQGNYVPTFKDPFTNSDHGTWDSNTWTITNTNYNGSTYGFKAGKHEMFPIPAYALQNNPNLKQNPGW